MALVASERQLIVDLARSAGSRPTTARPHGWGCPSGFARRPSPCSWGGRLVDRWGPGGGTGRRGPAGRPFAGGRLRPGAPSPAGLRGGVVLRAQLADRPPRVRLAVEPSGRAGSRPSALPRVLRTARHRPGARSPPPSSSRRSPGRQRAGRDGARLGFPPPSSTPPCSSGRISATTSTGPAPTKPWCDPETREGPRVTARSHSPVPGAGSAGCPGRRGWSRGRALGAQ